MQDENQSLQTLEDIKQMMTKSSRFISLSGWSGVAAGACALVAAWIAHQKISAYQIDNEQVHGTSLVLQLIYIAILTFVASFILAFLFTYVRSRKAGIPVWGYTARRVMLNVAVPMLVGGLLIWRMMDFGVYGLVAPACLSRSGNAYAQSHARLDMNDVCDRGTTINAVLHPAE